MRVREVIGWFVNRYLKHLRGEYVIRVVRTADLASREDSIIGHDRLLPKVVLQRSLAVCSHQEHDNDDEHEHYQNGYIRYCVHGLPSEDRVRRGCDRYDSVRN
jgi:hypothetical protein